MAVEKFECRYCGEDFESRDERDSHVASHFDGTGSIPKPSRNRNRDKSIINDYREEVESR